MSLLEESIQNWIVNETDGLIEGYLQNLPDISSISKLTEGKNREIWNFITQRVASKQSIARTRKILQLRRAQKEHEKYPYDNKENSVYFLQNIVDNAEDKVRFVEHTTKNLTKHVSFLNTSLKNKKEENNILNQKCAILELATLNLEEKNKSLIVAIDQLYILLNKLFANEKTKCFKYSNNLKTSKNAINGINVNDAFLSGILDEIMLIAKEKLFSEDLNFQIINLVLPVTELMGKTLIADIVNHLKYVSQQNSNSFQSIIEAINIDKAKRGEIELMSEIYLLSMKQDLVDSCFQRKKLGNNKYSLELDNIHFNKYSNNLQNCLSLKRLSFIAYSKNYLSLLIQNECLADSIQYLEKKLASELDITEKIEENNANQKAECQDTEIIMRDFYKNLSVLHGLLDIMPQTFSSMKLTLDSCRKFIDTQMLSTTKFNKDNCFISVVNNIDCDSELSFKLLESKEFLQDNTFTKLNLPAKVLEFLSLEPFNNVLLFIEKLISIKTKLSVVPKQLCYIPDEISPSISKEIIPSIEDNTVSLVVVEKNLFELTKSCKRLEVVLKDWWYQNAQYIPEFEHKGKTLKMWLAIVNSLQN